MVDSPRSNDVDTPSKYWCAVPECTADGRKKSNLEKFPWMRGVEFFAFPTEKKQKKARQQWLKMINRENYEPKRHHRVCSLHFVDGKPTEHNPCPTLFTRNNFKQPLKTRSQNAIVKRWKLETVTCQRDTEEHNEIEHGVHVASKKDTEIHKEPEPVLPLHLTIFDNQFNRDVYRHVSTKIEVETSKHEVENSSVCSDDKVETANDRTNNNPSVPSALKDIQIDHNYPHVKKIAPEYSTTGTQTALTGECIQIMEKEKGDFERKLKDKKGLMLEGFMENILKSDKSVKQYTGVPSKKLLNGIFKTLDEHESSLKYWSGKQSAKDMKYQEEGGKPGPKRKLSKYQEYVLTLVRLRLGLMTFFLADMFGVSNTRVSQIFTTWITFMCSVFGRFIKWQSRESNAKTMPLSFRKKFPRTRSIIDCTELFVQRPRTPSAQSSTYSSYKHHNTFKALVSINPTGAFNYVSDLWGGNVSDRYITEHCGYLEKIEPNDDIMADRGFTIRDLLTDKRATLNIPPFTHQCGWGKRKRLNVNEI